MKFALRPHVRSDKIQTIKVSLVFPFASYRAVAHSLTPSHPNTKHKHKKQMADPTVLTSSPLLFSGMHCVVVVAGRSMGSKRANALRATLALGGATIHDSVWQHYYHCCHAGGHEEKDAEQQQQQQQQQEQEQQDIRYALPPLYVVGVLSPDELLAMIDHQQTANEEALSISEGDFFSFVCQNRVTKVFLWAGCVSLFNAI